MLHPQTARMLRNQSSEIQNPTKAVAPGLVEPAFGEAALPRVDSVGLLRSVLVSVHGLFEGVALSLWAAASGPGLLEPSVLTKCNR